MERYVRIALPSALAGLVLSLLVGLIAGVGLGTALVRGIVSGVIFGAGGVGVVVLVERLLPGLITSGPLMTSDSGDNRDGSDRTAPSEPVQATGSRVNIVVEEDGDGEDRLSAPSGDDSGVDDEAAVEDAAGDAAGTDGDDRREAPEAVPEDDAAAPEEAVEELPRDREDLGGWDHGDIVDPAETAASVPSGDEDDEDSDRDELVEEVEEQSAENAETMMNEAIAEQRYGSGVEIDDSVLDEMPDIGSFTGAFVESGGDESDQSDGAGFVGYDGGEQPLGGGGGRSGGGRGGANDPSTVAKAIKTMLSRDGKE